MARPVGMIILSHTGHYTMAIPNFQSEPYSLTILETSQSQPHQPGHTIDGHALILDLTFIFCPVVALEIQFAFY